MTVLSLASLLIQETKAAIYQTAIDIATALNLPVSSWQPGDPTRSLYHLESEVLSALEKIVVGFISSGFIEYAEDDWLVLGAKQFFNVDVPEATYAEADIVLTNTGGGNYPLEPGDLIVKSSLTDKTYTNTETKTLAPGPGTTITMHVVADEAGSESSAGAGEIDELVTGLLGVTCTNPLAAIGRDRPTKTEILTLCFEKTGSLSAEGPAEIYNFVAKNKDLTGTASITRSRSYRNSDSGEVTVYLAGPGGAIGEPDRVLAETAIIKWALPQCITPTVLSASNVTIAVTYELWVYKSVNKSSDEVKASVLDALEAMIADHPIGGDVIDPSPTGILAISKIEGTIKGALSQIFKVSVTVPASESSLTQGQVAALGTVTATINFVKDP